MIHAKFSLVFGLICVMWLHSAISQTPKEQPESHAVDVSLIRVIANPKDFDRKKILVGGYLTIGLENNMLFFSKEDAVRHLFKNSIWVAYGPKVESKEDLKKHDSYYAKLKPFAGQYVLLEGTFNMNEPGHLDCCSGGIVDVTKTVPVAGR